MFDSAIISLLDAILHGVETRTSSPVQIERDDTTCESVSLEGLYPAGEGAGYAGGIVSAAVDGIRIAKCIASKYSIRIGNRIASTQNNLGDAAQITAIPMND